MDQPNKSHQSGTTYWPISPISNNRNTKLQHTNLSNPKVGTKINYFQCGAKYIHTGAYKFNFGELWQRDQKSCVSFPLCINFYEQYQAQPTVAIEQIARSHHASSTMIMFHLLVWSTCKKTPKTKIMDHLAPWTLIKSPPCLCQVPIK